MLLVLHFNFYQFSSLLVNTEAQKPKFNLNVLNLKRKNKNENKNSNINPTTEKNLDSQPTQLSQKVSVIRIA